MVNFESFNEIYSELQNESWLLSSYADFCAKRLNEIRSALLSETEQAAVIPCDGKLIKITSTQLRSLEDTLTVPGISLNKMDHGSDITIPFDNCIEAITDYIASLAACAGVYRYSSTHASDDSVSVSDLINGIKLEFGDLGSLVESKLRGMVVAPNVGSLVALYCEIGSQAAHDFTVNDITVNGSLISAAYGDVIDIAASLIDIRKGVTVAVLKTSALIVKGVAKLGKWLYKKVRKTVEKIQDDFVTQEKGVIPSMDYPIFRTTVPLSGSKIVDAVQVFTTDDSNRVYFNPLLIPLFPYEPNLGQVGLEGVWEWFNAYDFMREISDRGLLPTLLAKLNGRCIVGPSGLILGVSSDSTSVTLTVFASPYAYQAENYVRANHVLKRPDHWAADDLTSLEMMRHLPRKIWIYDKRSNLNEIAAVSLDWSTNVLFDVTQNSNDFYDSLKQSSMDYTKVTGSPVSTYTETGGSIGYVWGKVDNLAQSLAFRDLAFALFVQFMDDGYHLEVSCIQRLEYPDGIEEYVPVEEINDTFDLAGSSIWLPYSLQWGNGFFAYHWQTADEQVEEFRSVANPIIAAVAAIAVSTMVLPALPAVKSFIADKRIQANLARSAFALNPTLDNQRVLNKAIRTEKMANALASCLGYSMPSAGAVTTALAASNGFSSDDRSEEILRLIQG